MERRKFRTIFQESKDENLSLLADVMIKGARFNRGTPFSVSEGLGGIEFHKFRYFDLAVNIHPDGVLEIMGFYPEEKNG